MAPTVAQKIEAIASDPGVRLALLTVFAESMVRVRAGRPEWFFVRFYGRHLRLLAGRLIVLTIEGDRLWVTTNLPDESSELARLPSWQWDKKSYPRYKRVPSRNGYYTPALDSGGDWKHIQPGHFSYLDRVLTAGVAPDPRTSAHHEPQVVEYLMAMLGGGAKPEGDDRRHELPSPPLADEYVRALSGLGDRLTERHRALLKAHHARPDHEATASELAAAAGLSSHALVNAAYGRLGHELSDFLGTVPTKRRSSGTHRWWTLLSRGRRTLRGYSWQMLPQVAEALERLGWVAADESDFVSPDEVPSSWPEGAKKRIIVNAYERSLAARDQCIDFYDSKCVICGFDFGETYGEVAQGYIHVHHLEPLAEVRAERHVDPVNDLRPVCPNCHAVIHRRKPPYSLEEVREFLRLRNSSPAKALEREILSPLREAAT